MIRPGKLTREQQLRSQRYWRKFNYLNGFSYMCLGETVIILFAVKVEMSNAMIAILGSMIYVGYMLLLLGKWVTARIGATQSQATFWILRNIAALVVASAAPLYTFGFHNAATMAILLGAFGFYGCRGAGVIMGTPLVGEITCEKERAQFLADNSVAFQATALLALIGVSLTLRLSQSLWVLFGIIILGSLCGFTSSRLFAMIDESPAIRESARTPLWPSFMHLWRNSHYRSYLRMQCAYAAAALMICPIGMLTLKRGCGISDGNALLYIMLQSLVVIGMSRVAARLVNYFGTRRVIVGGFMLMLAQCLCWIFMPSSFNLLLSLIPFILTGACGITVGNASVQYFLRAVPLRHRVAASIFSALLPNAGAGLLGMLMASGLMKLVQAMVSADDPYTVFRVYFCITLPLLLLIGWYPVCRLKSFIGEGKH